MQLPPALRQAVETALEKANRAQLARAGDELSRRYRAEIRDGRAHLDSGISAFAYLAVRLPATYAAIHAALAAIVKARPDFAPSTMLDAGAGPGTALWAAADHWPGLGRVVMIEKSSAIRRLGERFSEELAARIQWRADDIGSGLRALDPSDLVTLAYVLDELEPLARDGLVRRLWDLTRDVLVIVEPGTPAGWERMLSARGQLIAADAHILAPCPHASACPLTRPDWCHFSRRVARSRIHRETKAADVPWEDEKFIYLAASRKPGAPISARVIAPPRQASGRASLKLCNSNGSADWQLITRREGDAYKQARRLEWGDAIDATSLVGKTE